MAAPKIMNGARAKVIVNGRVIGIFNNISYRVAYDLQPAYVLGRYSPASLDYTAMEPVNISAGAYRVVDHGAHADAAFPRLQDLLQHEYINLAVLDRATNKTVGNITFVRPASMSTGITARNLEEMTLDYVGLLVSDETAANEESADATPRF